MSSPTKSLYTEFDHYNIPMGEDGTPYGFIEALRDEAAKDKPIGWSEAHGGFWVVAGYLEAQEIIKSNSNAFSNTGILFPRYETGGAKMMLTEQDPPEHTKFRSLVAGPFSPGKAAELEPGLRESTNNEINKFIELGKVDVGTAFCDEIPGRLTAQSLGLPPDDGDLYRKWTYAMAQQFLTDPEGAAVVLEGMAEYFREVVQDRRKKRPGDDVLSDLVFAEVDGERLTDQELLDFFTVFIIAGIDNSARFLGTVMWRLSWDVELRRRLRANRSLIPHAVDELLRVYAPAVPSRLITEEVEVAGVKMRPGQSVMYCAPVNNRDPRVFDYPDQLIPERSPNRHLTLGQGIHRCLGAHLIRVESSIAIEEFLRRIPNFELDSDDEVKWSCGQVIGAANVPILFEPGEKEYV